MVLLGHFNHRDLIWGRRVRQSKHKKDEEDHFEFDLSDTIKYIDEVILIFLIILILLLFGEKIL